MVNSLTSDSCLCDRPASGVVYDLLESILWYYIFCTLYTAIIEVETFTVV